MSLTFHLIMALITFLIEDVVACNYPTFFLDISADEHSYAPIDILKLNPTPLILPPASKEHIGTILDEEIVSTRDGGVKYLVHLEEEGGGGGRGGGWLGWVDFNYIWITQDEPKKIDPYLLEYCILLPLGLGI